MAELPTGSLVAGCRIEAIVGRGGMGVVYRATQLSLDRQVALKAIAPEFAGDVTFRERFKRESRIAASIEHPNVIPVYEAGEGEGVLYLIMRYVEGTDLRALIDGRKGGLEPERASRLVGQVAAALSAAHRRELIHRDVKPANVLIDPAEEREHAYLTDFGIARHSAATSGLTHTGAVIGTIDYLAPERIQGDGGDGRADVYALGCVLFEALTGTTPFERDNDVAKMYAHMSAPVPSARERRPELPADLDELAQRAMAKDPDDRFATAAEMEEALADTVPTRPRTGSSPPPGAVALPPTEVTPRETAGEPVPSTEPPPAQTPAGEPPAPTEPRRRGSRSRRPSPSRRPSHSRRPSAPRRPSCPLRSWGGQGRAARGHLRARCCGHHAGRSRRRRGRDPAAADRPATAWRSAHAAADHPARGLPATCAGAPASERRGDRGRARRGGGRRCCADSGRRR